MVPMSDAFIELFGQTLVASGQLDVSGFQRARRAALKTGERFDRVLTKLGLVAERELAVAIARFLGIALFIPANLPREPVLSDRINIRFVRQHCIMPLSADDETIVLATTDPFNTDPVRAVAYLTGLHAKTLLILQSEFERAVQSVYAIGSGNHQTEADWLDDVDDLDLQRLRELANEAPVIRLVNQIIEKAVEARASDIHVEPNPDAVLIRYRIDGTLRPAQALPQRLRPAIVSRIKIMAKLDIAERRLPQDGRIKLAVLGTDVDFRISTVPSLHGESVVLRILDRKSVELDLQKLGFEDTIIASLRALMRQPNGIVLVTGPTGSGKTTTLYAALKEIASPDVKILTVEDPIEYQLAGVSQVQVQPAIELDFPRALRALLRQDPDVIMIGEIRDAETARIAVQASLTGHLVLSTLHTNSAAASITRLADMGIENFLIASTLKGVLAQRLVRRLCPRCAVTIEDEAGSPHLAICHGASSSPADLRRERGCIECQDVGFVGRTALSELLVVDERIHRLILESAPDLSLERAACEAGMITLHESGKRKVRRGETTTNEILRVTRTG